MAYMSQPKDKLLPIVIPVPSVIPAKAGIQSCLVTRKSGSRFRVSDMCERTSGMNELFHMAIGVGVLICLLSCWGVASAKATFKDIKIPRPKSITVCNQQAKWHIDKDVVRLTSILQIDEKGIVTKATPADTSQQNLFSHVEQYLKTLTFTPLIIDGKKVPGFALARVVFRPGVGWIDLEYALDSTGAISDDVLYDSLVPLNGYSTPRLATFPSYHSGLSWKDRLTVEPFILFKVSADSVGNITDAIPVKSTLPSLTSQLQSAVRWAKLTPPTQNGKRMASQSYLAVLFFPGNNYPTRPYSADSATVTGTLLERTQLRFLPDSSKYMALPVPRNPPYDSLYLKKAKVSGSLQTLTMFVQISPNGEAGLHIPPGLSPAVRTELRDVAGSMKFYPALDFSGRPVQFLGTIQIEFTISTLVRIRYQWLSTAR